ncbi:uncharacterized protein LOC131015415 isoform X2 [Salvia miltiorrhiza]|uniref:uncharacterized protein LOC131015415 isoform X2 n=1 Tax=Salvia miltiorrhiza TaxID=226208 RepID=UPI0025AC0444|nr:uncharacterized protein LOC131015415 isoform X2 [Salvia miltiorrhiza]
MPFNKVQSSIDIHHPQTQSVVVEKEKNHTHTYTMSGKENKIEEEEEEEETKVVHHWSHEHRLTLGEPRTRLGCFGCGRRFNEGVKAYECSQKCGNKIVLDEECAGLPRKNRHTMHPHHILIQHVFNLDDCFDETLIGKLCAICERFLINTVGCIFYKCTRAECELWMHMRCAQGSDMMYDAADDDDDDDEQCRTANHLSHPKHGLKLVRRNCSFKCDACGTTRRGKSYMCCEANCQYWIHESCASLPQTIETEYHSHSLSLSLSMSLLDISRTTSNVKCVENFYCLNIGYIIVLSAPMLSISSARSTSRPTPLEMRKGLWSSQ